MARPSQEEIKKELEDQEHNVYGEEAPGGSANSDPMDIDEAMGKAVGDDFDTVGPEPDEVNLADEIEDDEKVIAGLGNDDDDSLGPNPFDEEED